MVLETKVLRGKNALNKSCPTKEKTLNAKRQANEAKGILHLHQLKNPAYYAKVVVKKD